MSSQGKTLHYFINLDERGEFFSDVRNSKDETIFEIKSDADTGEVDMIEHGFMKNTRDVSGLLDYLQSVGKANSADSLVRAN
jgi:hypothetical protein